MLHEQPHLTHELVVRSDPTSPDLTSADVPLKPDPPSADGSSRPDPSGELIAQMDAAHTRASAAQRELFGLILAAEASEIWVGSEARDLAHWLCMRYSISTWKAHRWIHAAHALDDLPRISEALETGVVGVDKVVELTRFATPSTERGLVKWATTVSGARIRRRAELEARAKDPIEELRDPYRSRSVSMWYADEHRRFYLQASLPAADGAIVAQAIRRQAAQVPEVPVDPDASPSRRLADGLVRVCSGAIARDPDPDRATVVVHVSTRPVEDASEAGPERTIPRGVISTEITAAEIASGPVIHPLTARRLACDARIQVVAEDLKGDAIAMGRTSRFPSAALMRQLWYRDTECQFPNCGATRFLMAHHLVMWSRGGPTDLDKMALDCGSHHTLAHEGGWTQLRDAEGQIRWYRPNGSLYVPGPAPPPTPIPEPLEMAWSLADVMSATTPQRPPRLSRGP